MKRSLRLKSPMFHIHHPQKFEILKKIFWIPLNKLRSFNNAGPNSPSRILSNPERMKKIHYYSNTPCGNINLLHEKTMVFSSSFQGSIDHYWRDAEERVSITNLVEVFAFLSLINTQYKLRAHLRTIQNRH